MPEEITFTGKVVGFRTIEEAVNLKVRCPRDEVIDDPLPDITLQGILSERLTGSDILPSDIDDIDPIAGIIVSGGCMIIDSLLRGNRRITAECIMDKPERIPEGELKLKLTGLANKLCEDCNLIENCNAYIQYQKRHNKDS